MDHDIRKDLWGMDDRLTRPNAPPNIAQFESSDEDSKQRFSALDCLISRDIKEGIFEDGFTATKHAEATISETDQVLVFTVLRIFP